MKENGATTSVEEGTPDGDGDSIVRVGVEDCLPSFGVCWEEGNNQKSLWIWDV